MCHQHIQSQLQSPSPCCHSQPAEHSSDSCQQLQQHSSQHPIEYPSHQHCRCSQEGYCVPVISCQGMKMTLAGTRSETGTSLISTYLNDCPQQLVELCNNSAVECLCTTLLKWCSFLDLQLWMPLNKLSWPVDANLMASNVLDHSSTPWLAYTSHNQQSKSCLTDAYSASRSCVTGKPQWPKTCAQSERTSSSAADRRWYLA